MRSRPPGTMPIVSYPWYVPDWRNSETRLKLSLAERGLFRELIDHCFVEGSIPDDLKLIAGIAGCSIADVRRLFPRIRDQFDKEGNRLVNPRAAEILEKLREYHDSRRKAGTAGAKKRWRSDGSANGTAIDAGRLSDSLPQPQPQPQPRPQPHPQGPLTRLDLPDADKRQDPLYDRYWNFVDQWPDQDRRGIDDGARTWISLVDSGEIAEATIRNVFEGLERWKLSELWRRDNGKFMPAIANSQGTGWLQKRAWKDHPKPAEEDF